METTVVLTKFDYRMVEDLMKCLSTKGAVVTRVGGFDTIRLEKMSQTEVFRIATLVVDALTTEHSSQTLVNYRELQWTTDGASTPTFTVTTDELPGTSFLTNCGEQKNQTVTQIPSDVVSSKLGQTSTVWAQDASMFLSRKDPRSLSQKKKKTSVQEKDTSLASYEDAVLVLGRNNKTDTTIRPSQYHAFRFSLPPKKLDDGMPSEQSSFQTYRQLLMVRQPGLQRSGLASLSKDLGSFDSFDTVEICTGMCLFAEQDLDLCTLQGTIQAKRLAQLPISICEKEIITRLSMTIANVAAVYRYGMTSKRSLPLRINVDIPSIQYYMDALEAFDNGGCEPSDVLEWMAAIKNRRRLLFNAFSRAIEYGLRERGLPGTDVNITLSCGLKLAGSTIFGKLRTTQRNFWLRDIMNSVMQDSDEYWPEFLSILSEAEQTPSTWRDFHTLSYMYEVIKPVLRARSATQSSLGTNQTSTNTTGTTRSLPSSPAPRTTQNDYFDSIITGPAISKPPKTPRVLLVAIDDSDEGRIYTKSYNVLCKLSTSAARSPGANSRASFPIITRILTICPAPQIIVGTSGVSSEWTRPSLWRAQLRSTIDANRDSALRFQTSEGSVDTDSDVLKKVYGSKLVSCIEEWLRK